MTRYVILYRTEADGETYWPLFTVTSQPVQQAIAVFTSEENARHFAGGYGLGDPWQVGEMPEAEFFRWLRTNLVKGVSLLAVNPRGTDAEVRDIFELLAEIEPGGKYNPEPGDN